MVYAGRRWEEGIFGSVLHEGAREAGLVEPKGWVFMLGLKDMAAAVPVGWTMYAEEEEVAEGCPDKIIAVPARTQQYQVARAKHLARYVRELLTRARDVEQEDREVWVKLDRKIDEVVASVRWSRDRLASVWVSEKIVTYQPNLKEEGDAEGDGPDTVYARVTEAVGRLNEVARDSLVACHLGGEDGGRRFQGFLGPGEVLTATNLRLKKVGEVEVIPAALGERRACIGSKPAPVYLGGGGGWGGSS